MRGAAPRLANFNLLLAEDAFDDISENTPFAFRNIAEFEHLLAEVVDCIVIFPESPGSFAELGFFARSEQARIRTLVVNPLHLQGEESFINAGIIDYINRESFFRPQLHVDFNRNSRPDFSAVIKRLEKRLTKKNRKKLELLPAGDMPAQLRLYIVTYVVSTCRVLHIEDLKNVINECLPSGADFSEFDEILSFCLGANLLARAGSASDYLVPKYEKNPFIEVGGSAPSKATSACIQFYQKHFPAVFSMLRNVA